MSLFGFLLAPQSLVESINVRLARIETNQRQQTTTLVALTVKGSQIMQALDDLKTAVGEVKVSVARAVSELGDLATKIENTVDPAELAALAAELRGVGATLGAKVDEVDTDGSSPAQPA